MNKMLIPDLYYKNIFEINYVLLKERGIKLLLFDLDNTICCNDELKVSERVIYLMQQLEEMGFDIVIFSNAFKGRVKGIKDQLNVDSAYLCFKPLKFKYKKVLDVKKVKNFEVAAIGDQIFTDVKGANKMEILSILVNPLGSKESITAKFNRLREKKVYKYFEENGILKRGFYSE